MTRLKGGLYLTVDEYRRKIGYSSTRPIYRRLREGTIEGAVMHAGRWMIPNGAILEDKRLKTGKYIAWRKRYGKTAGGGS